MCNCTKSKSAQQARTYTGTLSTQEFALVKRDGSSVKFGSRLEADAQNARDGYTGIVKPVGS